MEEVDSAAVPAPVLADGEAVLDVEVLLALGATTHHPSPAEIVGEAALAEEQSLGSSVSDLFEASRAASEHHAVVAVMSKPQPRYDRPNGGPSNKPPFDDRGLSPGGPRGPRPAGQAEVAVSKFIGQTFMIDAEFGAENRVHLGGRCLRSLIRAVLGGLLLSRNAGHRSSEVP